MLIMRNGNCIFLLYIYGYIFESNQVGKLSFKKENLIRPQLIFTVVYRGGSMWSSKC